MRNLFILVLLISFALPASSQTKPPLAVNATIIGKGEPRYRLAQNEHYIVKLEVTNNGDTTLPVTFWDCSWFWEFKLNMDSIYKTAWGCDGNGPEPVDLLPQQSIFFNLELYTERSLVGKTFKIGFANCWKEFITGFNLVMDIVPKGDIYWSDPLTLEKLVSKIGQLFSLVRYRILRPVFAGAAGEMII